MPLVDGNLNIIQQAPEKALAELENSASDYRLVGWFLVIVGTLFFGGVALMVVNNPAAIGRIIPIYWLLAIWGVLYGIVYLHLAKALANLKSSSLSDRSTLGPVAQAKKGFRFCVCLEVAIGVGTLFLYPPALIFIIGGIIAQAKYSSSDRATLTLIAGEIIKNTTI